MKETNALRLSLLDSIILNGLPMRYAYSGFTLVELMVAAAASLILTSIAFASLLTFQQMSQKQDEKAAQKAELQRALRFIAGDIQEGKSIESGEPSELFQINRPDGSTIVYYSESRGSRPWSGPKIVYRKDSKEGLSYALIDQITDRSPFTDRSLFTEQEVQEIKKVCPVLPIAGEGVSVDIKDRTQATVCLIGHLVSSNKVLAESIQMTTRSK
jgi:prepilin-type N-terminal cleavage/methylation domain-containing protein